MDLNKVLKLNIQRIDVHSKEKNVNKSNKDYNLYYYIYVRKYTSLLLYVNNLLLTKNDYANIQRIQKHQKNKYEMIDLKGIQMYLRAQFETTK